MQVYSETIFSFIQKANKMLRDILIKETAFNVRRSRFEYKNYLYPIDIVVFEGDMIGYFEANRFQIGLNKSLIYQAKDNLLRDIIRHELAHYITFLFYGADVKAHGAEFKHICDLYKWPEHIKKASMDFELSNLEKASFHSEKVLNKVKNLLKLAQSSNQHESELATVKANELLIKHNLEVANIQENNEFYVHRLLSRKRKDSKITCIYDILKHFMVKPIISYGKEEVCIEVTGKKLNVELAQYISSFLDAELERLWKIHKFEHGLKGLKAKNSFLQGVAHGYNQKMNTIKYSETDKSALIKIHTELDLTIDKIYRRLSSSRSSSSRDEGSYNLGSMAGKNLNINKGVKSTQSNKFLEFKS